MLDIPTKRRAGALIAAMAMLAAVLGPASVSAEKEKEGPPQRPLVVQVMRPATPQLEALPGLMLARAEAQRAVQQALVESRGELRRALAEAMRTSSGQARGVALEAMRTGRHELISVVADLHRELGRIDRHLADGIDGLACSTPASTSLAVQALTTAAKLPAQGIVAVQRAIVTLAKLLPRMLETIV